MRDVSTLLDMTRIPTCTYRLQFNRWFTFSQAREIVPYLDALGISDIYASPYFNAGPDSLHGYDICDHNSVNQPRQSREDYEAWIGALHAQAIGQILDFVPNHMGISGTAQCVVVGRSGERTFIAFRAVFRYRLAAAEVRSSRQRSVADLGAMNMGAFSSVGSSSHFRERGRFSLLYFSARLPIAPRNVSVRSSVALQRARGRLVRRR